MDIIEIDDTIKPSVYTQDYTPKIQIEGIKIIPIKCSVGDEGDFSEIIRLNPDGEIETLPGFKLAQVNRTHLFAGSIKAWHVHQKQNEIWYVPPQFQIMVGLWDLRKDSPTLNKTVRINLGGGASHMILIPRGVAHGSAVFGDQAVNMYYFVDQHFNINDPDEKRVRWDFLGKEFWQPERD